MNDYIIRNINKRIDLALFHDFPKAAKHLAEFCRTYNKDPGNYTIVRRERSDKGEFKYEPVVELG